jgi:hypothetical protein
MNLLITHSSLPSCYFQFIRFKYKHSGTQTLRHSGNQALRHSLRHSYTQALTQALRHSGTQALRHAGTQALRHSDTQALRDSDTQTRRHSDTQPLRHSDTHTPRHSDTPRLKKFQNYEILKQQKIEITFLKSAPNFSLRKRKLRETKVEEEYSWATTQTAELSCCDRPGSNVFWVGISAVYTCIYAHDWQHVYSIPTCTGNSWTSLSRSMSLVLSTFFCYCYKGDRPRSL